MRSGSKRFQQRVFQVVVAVSFALVTAFLLALFSYPANAQSPEPTAEPTELFKTRPATESMNPDSWILIEELPADATQADYGEQYYIFVCQACHGDVGRGLTAEWLAQWAPDDQNCWQTKCHASSHPPDGFTIPYTVPPVVGEDALLDFRTAFDLYNYIRHAMPYQAPGTMLDEEYWAVTAYLIRKNQGEELPEPLTPENAVSMALRPGETVTILPTPTNLTPTATQPEPSASTGRSLMDRWPYWGGGLVVVIGVVFLIWRLVSRRSSP